MGTYQSLSSAPKHKIHSPDLIEHNCDLARAMGFTWRNMLHRGDKELSRIGGR